VAVAVFPLAGAGWEAPPAHASAPCPDEDLVPTAHNLDRVEAALLCTMNRERVRAGAVALARAPQLDSSARFHTVDMVRRRYLGHEASGHPPLLARIRGYGYFTGARDGYYAENVGVGPGANGTARALVTAWMDSPSHRTNLLFPSFRDVGISAIATGPDPVFYADFPSTVYTTDFGRRYARPRCVRRAATRTRTTRATPRRRYCR
jgi:uncharacterized protein YkwD